MTDKKDNEWDINLDDIDIEGILAERAARPKSDTTRDLFDFKWEFTLDPQYWSERRKEKAKEN